MKTVPRQRMFVLMALCLNIASLPLNGQDRTITEKVPPLSVTFAESLQNRLQGVDNELAAIRERTNNTPTDEDRRVLLQRIDRVAREVEQISRDVACIKQQQQAKRPAAESPAASTAIGNAAPSDLQGRLQESAVRCRLTDMTANTPGRPSASAGGQNGLTGGSIIQLEWSKRFDINLTSGGSELIKGKNHFCVEFRDVHNHNLADPGGVQAEATMTIGRVKAMRAVVRLVHAGAGLYCADVSFPLPGSWFITVQHRGPFGSGKAVFATNIRDLAFIDRR